jgi:quercetin dioxygenase-like cupin family protein
MASAERNGRVPLAEWLDLFQVDAARRASGRSFREFLRVPSMSAGLYVLARGAEDTQRPHKEDEVYFVLAGRAKLDADGDVRPVQTGSIVYVGQHVRHRFVENEEELRVLVFFAPAETP